MKVLVSGASGFVGQHVLDLLLSKGHEVFALSRRPEKHREKYPSVHWIKWERVSEAPDLAEVQELDGALNLMGENLASKRWNNSQKKLIYNSRVDGTKLLLKGLANAGLRPKVFVSASATGIYGHRGDGPVDEQSRVQNDFLGNLCQAWEQAALEGGPGIGRTVVLRAGLVLGKDGGLAAKIAPLFKLGLGAKLGDGNFYMSWIHVKDLARVYLKALEDEDMSGIYNAVSPFPATNSEFTGVLADAVRRPAPFKAPKFALKLVMGEMGEYVLKGAKVEPKKLKKENFHYLYPTVELALKDVVSKA